MKEIKKYQEIPVVTSSDCSCSLQLAEVYVEGSIGTHKHDTVCLILTNTDGLALATHFSLSQVKKLISTLKQMSCEMYY